MRRSLPAAPPPTTVIGRSGATAGAMAASAWLRNLGPVELPTQRWQVEIAMDVVDQTAPAAFDEATATRFHLDLYRDEWGLYFSHAGRWSWIRVTDVAFVHGRDDHRLLDWTPALKDITTLLRRLEQQHRLAFRRELATVQTNLPAIEPAVRSWLATL